MKSFSKQANELQVILPKCGSLSLCSPCLVPWEPGGSWCWDVLGTSCWDWALGKLCWANRKMLKGLRTASKDSLPSPSITRTQGSSQPNNAPTCLHCSDDNTGDDNTGAFSRNSPHTANSFILTRTGIFFSHPWRYWPKTHSLKATPCGLAKQLACFPLAWYQSHWLLKPW